MNYLNIFSGNSSAASIPPMSILPAPEPTKTDVKTQSIFQRMLSVASSYIPTSVKTLFSRMAVYLYNCVFAPTTKKTATVAMPIIAPTTESANPSGLSLGKEVKTEEKITSGPEAAVKSTTQSTAENCFKYLGLGLVYNYLALKVIEPIMMSGLDFCPHLPENIYRYSATICSISTKFNSTNTQDSLTIIMPIMEELVFRVGLQELLLKRLPKALLGEKASLVDSNAAKIARVTISAGAFSFAHAFSPRMGYPNCSAARFVSTFVLGLGLGALQESTGNPLYSMSFHAGNNAMVGYFLRAIRGQLQCEPYQ